MVVLVIYCVVIAVVWQHHIYSFIFLNQMSFFSLILKLNKIDSLLAILLLYRFSNALTRRNLYYYTNMYKYLRLNDTPTTETIIRKKKKEEEKASSGDFAISFSMFFDDWTPKWQINLYILYIYPYGMVDGT